MRKPSRTLTQAQALSLSLLPTGAIAQTDGSDSTVALAGANFTPNISGTLFTSTAEGCIRLTGAAPALVSHTLSIPHGATIDTMELDYFDTLATGDVAARLYLFLPEGNFNSIGLISSSGAGGFGSVTSGQIGHTVDSLTNSLELRLEFEKASTNLRGCAVRVNYSLPPGP